MAVLIWSDRDGVLGNSIRSGRRVALSAEEFRPEAEALDRQLDDLLDMAWQALTIITDQRNGKPKFNSFEQVWVLGRAVYVSEVMRHEAMQGEVRTLLWQALTPKAWYGIRHDGEREPRWRELIPKKADKWHKKPKENDTYHFLEIGYWLREQQLHDAGEIFDRHYSNAEALYKGPTLRSLELRQAILQWLRRQSNEVHKEFTKGYRGKSYFAKVCTALKERFPPTGPGSALLPQHYPEDELRDIVCAVLDAARDKHFQQLPPHKE